MKNTIKNKLSMIAGFAITVALTSQAAVISDWSFANVSGLEPDADIPVGTSLIAAVDNVVVAGITSSDLISGGSLRYEDAGGVAGELNLKNFHITEGPGRGEFYYTLTADPGQLYVTSLTMTSRRNGGGAPDNLKWWASIDGGAFEVYGAEETGVPVAAVQNTFTESIAGATSVTFKFLLDNTAMNGNIHFDQFQVQGSVGDPALSPPGILSFSADKARVFSGEPVTLEWEVADEDTLILNPGNIDVKDLTTTNFTVTADTTYELIAGNANGNATNSVSVVLITTPPVINSYTVSSTNVLSGTPVTLNWNIVEASALELNGSVVTGSSTQVVVNADTTYELIASNINGSSTGSVSVTTVEIAETIINIDLTSNDSTGPSGYNLPGVVGAQGQAWNAVSNENAYASLVDANGAATTIGFDITSTIPAEGNFTTLGGSSFFTSWVFLGNQDSETQASFTINGLDDAKVYDLYFYAAWPYIAAGSEFSVDGGTTWSLSDGVPTGSNVPFSEGHSYVKIAGVPTDGSGNVDGLWKSTLEGGSTAHRGMFNALQIVEAGTLAAPPVTDLRISGPVDGGNGMVLEWTGEDGKPYGVETNSNLIISDGWATWITGQMGDGGTITVTNTIGPDQTFYRVISE